MQVTRLSRAEQRAATRARLLEAAAGVFAEKGFQGASVDDVAERAGFSKGAVYSNFESKEDLLLAVLEDRLGAQVREPERALGDDRTALMLTTELWLHAMRHPDTRYKLAARLRVLREALGSKAKPFPFDDGEAGAVLLALGQGIAMQRMVDPTGLPEDLFGRVLGLLVETTR